ncbi:MAG: endonuclease domain-containing protein [Oscillospiraceae bacterium]|nr:endonuclease domain-containing protein [Oscillospiraceae bacterium]
MIEYNKNNISLARVLRKNMTKQERKLWFEFLREYPLRFQRQKAIGEYIVDFYCAKARVVVEIDGSQHYEDKAVQADIKRTDYLKSKGLKVLRFSNFDIEDNMRGVCEMIDAVVKESLPQSAEADSSLIRGSHK